MIVPIDLPGIPEWFEKQLEAGVRGQIPLMVDELLERIRLRAAA